MLQRYKHALGCICPHVDKYMDKSSRKECSSQQTTGEELATAAALRELGMSGMAFTGVR